MKIVWSLLLLLTIQPSLYAQFPWERPLKIAYASDGINFDPPTIFQDSSGVPSAIRWKGDTLICAFQWFRLPQNSPTWDKVAVKFSYDKGLNWTPPQPITINGLPANYQRPFDPTLALMGGDSIRVYFSSSDGVPMGLDSTVNTYSAKSADGIHFVFESNARVDELHNRVIDPAAIYFQNSWHYTAPIGSPQQGAYHYLSPDGINFNKVADIPSDNLHNWTGNLMISDDTLLRFYGGGPNNIWFKSSSNGGVWSAYMQTNIQGGDPSVVQTGNSQYLMIWVGEPYTPSAIENAERNKELLLYPNPVDDFLFIDFPKRFLNNGKIEIFDSRGICVNKQNISASPQKMATDHLTEGIYYVKIAVGDEVLMRMMSKW